MLLTHAFGDFIPDGAKYLLLGSFTANSLDIDPEYDWFYGSKRNQFWRIIEQTYNVTLPDKAFRIERLALNPNFPLKDKLYCEHCGQKMYGANCHGKLKPYALYYCHNPNCPNKNQKSVSKTDFENEFYEYLEVVKPQEQDFKEFSEVLIKRYEQRQTEFETRSSSLRKQLDTYEQEKMNLINMGKRGVLDAEEAKVEMDKIKKNISILKLDLNETHEEEFRIEMLLEYARTFFRIE